MFLGNFGEFEFANFVPVGRSPILNGHYGNRKVP